MEKDYLKLAHELGFSEAVMLENLSVECKEDLRSCCNPRQCPNHGQNWVCPPACGTLEECRKRVMKFETGILLRSVTDLTPPTAPETYLELNREHNLRLKKMVEAVKPEVDELLPLTSGGCIFCDTCQYPEPCIHPDVKMESLSAHGIDVGELSKMAGLPYSFREDRIYLTALLLIKPL